MLSNCKRGLERAEARGNTKYIASWRELVERTRGFEETAD